MEGGTVTLIGSVVSGNRADTGPEIAVNNGSALVVDGHNVSGTIGSAGMDGARPGATDHVLAGALNTVINPALADNGGATATHTLVEGAPAPLPLTGASLALSQNACATQFLPQIQDTPYLSA